MKKKNKFKIIPFFLPFLGCKERCVYCDQYALTDVTTGGWLGFQLEKLQVEKIVNNIEEPFVIGFYGGSFLELPEFYWRKVLIFLNFVKKKVSIGALDFLLIYFQ